ncbi:hypothetical protein D3C86_1606240 [compost metagenome]
MNAIFFVSPFSFTVNITAAAPNKCPTGINLNDMFSFIWKSLSKLIVTKRSTVSVTCLNRYKGSGPDLNLLERERLFCLLKNTFTESKRSTSVSSAVGGVQSICP